MLGIGKWLEAHLEDLIAWVLATIFVGLGILLIFNKELVMGFWFGLVGLGVYIVAWAFTKDKRRRTK